MTSERQDGSPCFYKLNAPELPDDLYRKQVPASDWISTDLPWMKTTCDPKGFGPGELNTVFEIDRMVDLDRCIGISLYMMWNVSPFLIPLLVLGWIGFGITLAKRALVVLVAYQLGLYASWKLVLTPIFLKRYNQNVDSKDPIQSQYVFTERNVTKYCSMSYVWPKSIHRPALEDRPIIFCVIPHGLAPYGIVGYPYFSKIWNSRLCSWTCAPPLLKLPFVGSWLRSVGYIPAKSNSIEEALSKKDRNVGVVLDGIDGMFHNASQSNTEVGAIRNRKGIVKIALRANAVLVPVYGFGHTLIYDVWVDPFGILKFLSSTFGLSLTPFSGRWNWFLGPPKRTVPISVCLGDPILPPPTDNNTTTITQEQIEQHHAKLLEGFSKVFETHKRAYYGEAVGANKKLVFVK